MDLFEYVAREAVLLSSMFRRDGKTARYSIYQHDLVEAGLATNSDEDREFVTFLRSLPTWGDPMAEGTWDSTGAARP